MSAEDTDTHQRPWRAKEHKDIIEVALLWSRIDDFIRCGLREERKINALVNALQSFAENILEGIETDRNGQVFAEMSRPIAQVTDDQKLIAWCEKHGITLLGEVLLIRARTKPEVKQLWGIADSRNISGDRLAEWVPPYAHDQQVCTLWEAELPKFEYFDQNDPGRFRRNFFSSGRAVAEMRKRQREFRANGSPLRAGMFMPTAFLEAVWRKQKECYEIERAFQQGYSANRGGSGSAWDEEEFAKVAPSLLPRIVALQDPSFLLTMLSKWLGSHTVPDETRQPGGFGVQPRKNAGWGELFAAECARHNIRSDRDLLVQSSPELFGERAEMTGIVLGLVGLRLGMTEAEVNAIFNN